MTTSNPVTLVIDDIIEPLNQNSTVYMHWSTYRYRARTIRQLAFYTWRNAGRPLMDRAAVEVYLQFRDRRKRDTENWAPTWKHALDGIVKGPIENPPNPFRGILPDDDPAHLTGPFPYVIDDPDRALRGVRLTFVFDPL